MHYVGYLCHKGYMYVYVEGVVLPVYLKTQTGPLNSSVYITMYIYM